MDTAAAAAAAVVVDLSTEGGSKSSATKTKLLNKPQPKSKSKSKSNYTRVGVASIATSCSELDIVNCLGSTVESMSATPPTTPTRNETGEAMGLGLGMNGLKDAIADRDCQQEIALAPTTSTSSTNASTTPTSALLTTTTTTATTATATTTITQTTTTTTSTSSSSQIVENNNNIDQLLHWQDMPKYLQFNPYVLKGYRPLQTFKGCLLSLFYWHNETINILTHAIPIFYILAIVPGLMPWDSGFKFLSFCHVFGSVAPWCGSFIYHLFMNIEKGENVYYRLLKLDMVGIWVSQSFGALPLVTATTLCFNPFIKWPIIISYCLLSLWGLYK